MKQVRHKTKAKNNPLSNKEFLREIAKSKNSFSYFIDEEFANYDIIIGEEVELTADIINECRQSKATELENEERKRQKLAGVKGVIKVEEVDFRTIDVNGLIIRKHTYDHIPDLPKDQIKGTPKKPKDFKVKLNFIPFKQYVIEYDGPKDEIDVSLINYREVGRSHWKNGLDNGQFTQQSGRITERLGQMYKELVDRYGQKLNWRGYCVDEQTDILTNNGWRNIDTITDDAKVVSCDNGNLVWSDITSIYRGTHNGMMHSITGGLVDMLVTPGHKLLTERGLVPVELLNAEDRVVVMGKSSADCGIDFNGAIMESEYVSVAVSELDFNGGYIDAPLSKETNANEPTVAYDGRVWCVSTEYGCFVARRQGKVYITGNSYLDEMKSQARMQLIVAGLKFDECRSQNPFAYFTTIMTNAFTGVFHEEKKSQSIRDDILTKLGHEPSHTRQVENEFRARE